MRNLLLASLLAATVALSGCGPAETGRVPESAQRVFDLLRDRKYAEIYDEASSAFRKTYSLPEFVAKMQALEGFGQLAEIELAEDPSVVEEQQGRLATVGYTARFTFAEGPFRLTLRANDMLGTWELEGYDYAVESTTYDPPYPADAEGADQLARRFFHLWQMRRYGDLRKVMRIEEDPQKVRHFLENLEKGGKVLTLTRVGYDEQASARRTGASARYALKFDKGKGSMVFKLVADGGAWRVDSADYAIEYILD